MICSIVMLGAHHHWPASQREPSELDAEGTQSAEGEWRTGLDSLPVNTVKHPDKSKLRMSCSVYLKVPSTARHSRKSGRSF